MKLYLTKWFRYSIQKPVHIGMYQVLSKNWRTGKDIKNGDVFFAYWDGKVWRGTASNYKNNDWMGKDVVMNLQNRTWRGIEILK